MKGREEERRKGYEREKEMYDKEIRTKDLEEEQRK